jgi:hypothetical protein
MNEEDLFKINVATRQEIEEHLAFFKIVPRFNRVLECDLATHSWDYILTEDKSGFDEPTDVQPVEWVYYSGEISRFNDVNTLLIRGEYQSESMKHEIFLFHKMGLYPFEYGSCLYDDEIKVNQDSLLKDDTLSIQYPSCYSELEIMEPHDIRGDITRTMIDIRQKR